MITKNVIWAIKLVENVILLTFNEILSTEQETRKPYSIHTKA